MLVTKCNRRYHGVTLLLWEWGGVVGGVPRPFPPPLLRFFSELKNIGLRLIRSQVPQFRVYTKN